MKPFALRMLGAAVYIGAIAINALPQPTASPLGLALVWETSPHVAVGTAHSCGINASGNAYCWGFNHLGMLGTGDNVASNLPRAVRLPARAFFTQLTAGSSHSCALGLEGEAYCWGDNPFGQLGNRTFDRAFSPTAVAMPERHRFSSISAGDSHTCALTLNGRAYCWGANHQGYLGNGTTDHSPLPKAVVMPPRMSFVQLSSGYSHSCALTATGRVYCWGANDAGGLGNNTHEDSLIPKPITSPVSSFKQVSAGHNYTCALDSGGKAYCWGSNDEGQLGNGNFSDTLFAKTVVVPDGVSISWISAGFSHTCALTLEGEAYCWGANNTGQLGNGSFKQSPIPTAVSLPQGVRFTKISAGSEFGCATALTNTAYCWGYNDWGQLGNGSRNNSPVPVKVNSF